MSQAKKGDYPIIQKNGQIFPTWVLSTFKDYKLAEIFRAEGEDPCNVDSKTQVRKYQDFLGKFLSPDSPYQDILLYWGVGSGKTVSAINVMNILYHYDNNYSFVILIKAALRNDPWMKDLNNWMYRGKGEENNVGAASLKMFQNVHFVHYDSGYAHRDFEEVIKKLDPNKPIQFVIDESHNFIRNAHSNITSGTEGKAVGIYRGIQQIKKTRPQSRVILISATPAINIPFELAMNYNLMRPGIFPDREEEFNRLFVSRDLYPTINPLRKNMFQRRIMGLTSYYVGATPDLFAEKVLKEIQVTMTPYQYKVYREYEQEEEAQRLRAAMRGGSSKLYRTYTRQASNFVFPQVSSRVDGFHRPRPSDFKTRGDIDALMRGLNRGDKLPKDPKAVAAFQEEMKMFLAETTEYFLKMRDSEPGALQKDMDEFRSGFQEKYGGLFDNFWNSSWKKSKVLQEMYRCGPKITQAVFHSHGSRGKVMIYSHYVLMEGSDIIQLYLRLMGYDQYTNNPKPNMGYAVYHGGIDKKVRVETKKAFNDRKENVRGEKCKIFIFSPSAAEGIELLNVVQGHTLSPDWNPTRDDQVEGRAMRQCSHRDLPMAERIFIMYRYYSIKPKNLDDDDKTPESTDMHIASVARAKRTLIDSFQLAVKEVAVDCELFRNHNMINEKYTCFQFPQEIVMGDRYGPAYLTNIEEDFLYSTGSHAENSVTKKLKVYESKGIYQDGKKSFTFWYHPETRMCYDHTTHYPIGIVSLDADGHPNKSKEGDYIIDENHI